MILQFLLLIFTVDAAVAQSACPSCNVCVADGCFQQLAGISNFPVQTTVDDCRSFLWAPVTVADATVTATTVVTALTTSTTHTTSIPGYANSCTGASAYSSACGCIGVEASSTTYIHIPEATILQQIVGTEYALQLTNDIANGPYNGSYLYPSTDGYSTLLLFTSDASQAGKFYSNSTGNLTDGNAAPFAYEPDATGNFFSLLSSDGYSSQLPANCWIDSNSIFQCAGLGGRYLGIHNATMQLKSFNTVKEIYLSGATGPILLKAVTHPANGGNGTAAAVARPFKFRNNPSSTGVFGAQTPWYLCDQVESPALSNHTETNAGVKRLVFYSSISLATLYLVDPTNGNVRSGSNEPFIYDSVTPEEHIWIGFPDPVEPSFKSIIVTCTMSLSSLIFSCQDENYRRLAVDIGPVGSAGRNSISIFSDAATLPQSNAWEGPLNMVGLPQ